MSPASANTCTITGTSGDDVLDGTSGADVICGLQGHDIINGLGGDDVIYGGVGEDTLIGGVGNDTIYGEGDNDVLVGEAGDDAAYGGDGDDSLLGAVGADVLVGNNGNDTLEGGQGADALNGGSGNDLLEGGADDDLLQGGDNDDILRGARGLDRLHGGIGDDALQAGEGDDFLYGNEGNDRLAGGLGVDTIEGNFGADTLMGDAGVDQLNGGADADTCLSEPSVSASVAACEVVKTESALDRLAALPSAMSEMDAFTDPATVSADGATLTAVTEGLAVQSPAAGGAVLLASPVSSEDGVGAAASVTTSLPPELGQLPAPGVAFDGSVVYDSSGTTDLVVQAVGGGVRLSTILQSPAAPTTYTYSLDVPSDAHIYINENGEAVAEATDGRLLAAFASPWARDASGVDVPTRYEVRGRSIAQIIDTSAGGYVYPITADPYKGSRLFKTLTRTPNFEGRGYGRYNLTRSDWGKKVHKPTSAGVGIMLEYGWPEVTSYFYTRKELTSRATYKQQYDCHAWYGFTEATWNLEGHRASKPDWPATFLRHTCNW